MRKIETQMNTAISSSIDWKSDNTSVYFDVASQTSRVFLHGNHIATVGDDYVEIFDGGYQSQTTKSRLNAIINEFCNALTDGIFQRNYQWFVKDNDTIKEFSNGYVFS